MTKTKHFRRLVEAEAQCKPLPGETFKEHPYHKDIWVSDFGRVVNRRGTFPHLRKPTLWPPAQYLCVHINPGHKKCYIHTLVNETWNGTRPKGRTESGKRPLYTTSHLDNNPLNNFANNLCWQTTIDNLENSPDWTGAKKLSIQDMEDIRAEYLLTGTLQREIAVKYGVTLQIINAVINNRLGYKKEN